MADNLKKEIKIPVVADPKQADAQVDKFKKDSEKKGIDIPVNVDLKGVTDSLSKIGNLVENINKAFGKLDKDGKNFKFSGMQKSLDEVLKKLEKVTMYSKKGKPDEIQMFRVNVAGFTDLKNITKDIQESLVTLNDNKIDTSSFDRLEEALRGIESILTSICTGLNFEQIRPSSMVQKDIEKTTKELEALAKQEEKIAELEKYLNKTGIDKGKKILDFGTSEEVDAIGNLVKKMREYVSLGGDLSKIQFKYKGLDDTTKQMYSLADVFEILQDENKIDLINDSQITNDVDVIRNLRNEMSKLNEELERAQIRENRDLNVSLDTKSVEEFSQAIATALEKIGEINFSIPEGFTFEGLSTENLDKIIVKLDEIVSSITNLATLLSTGVDFSKINENIDDKFKENKHDVKIGVSPDINVDEFVSSIENVIKQSNKKVKIETIPVLSDNQENSDDNQDNEFIDDEVIKEKLETIQGYFQTITNDFGDNLSDAISDFKESLEVTTGQIDYDTIFASLRQSLLDIVTQFQNSLQSVGLSSTQLDEAYQMIKGWNDASNIIVKSGNKDAERAAFINRSNGKVSNGYAYDKNNEFSNKILDDLKRLEEGVSGKIGELYDTWIHSHPFEKTINGLKAIGSDVGFSSEDLSVYKNKLLNSGITNMMVTSNGKYANINWDGISEAIINEIIKEFKASDIFENGKFKGSLATENGIYNYDKQTELINNAIVKAMSNVGIKDAESRLTTGNIEDLKVDMSALKEEEQDAKIKAEELLNILSKISDALTSLDQSGAFKFEGMDSFITQLENAKSLMTEICTSFNDNFKVESSNVLTDLFKEDDVKVVATNWIKALSNAINLALDSNSPFDSLKQAANDVFDKTQEFQREMDNFVQKSPVEIDVNINSEDFDWKYEEVRKKIDELNKDVIVNIKGLLGDLTFGVPVGGQNDKTQRERDLQDLDYILSLVKQREEFFDKFYNYGDQLFNNSSFQQDMDDLGISIDRLIEALKNTGFADKDLKPTFSIPSDGAMHTVGAVGEKYVLLGRDSDQPIGLKDAKIKKQKVDELVDMGCNIARIVMLKAKDSVYDQTELSIYDSDLGTIHGADTRSYFEVQERKQGINHRKAYDIVENMSKEQLIQFLRDAKLILSKGLAFETGGDNFLANKTDGLIPIDIAAQDEPWGRLATTLEELVSYFKGEFYNSDFRSRLNEAYDQVNNEKTIMPNNKEKRGVDIGINPLMDDFIDDIQAKINTESPVTVKVDPKIDSDDFLYKLQNEINKSQKPEDFIDPMTGEVFQSQEEFLKNYSNFQDFKFLDSFEYKDKIREIRNEINDALILDDVGEKNEEKIRNIVNNINQILDDIPELQDFFPKIENDLPDNSFFNEYYDLYTDLRHNANNYGINFGEFVEKYVDDLKQGFEKLGGKEAPKVKVDPLVDKAEFTDKVIEQLKGIETTSTNSMQYETEDAELLRQKLVDVATTVDTKTNAFKEEEQVVVGTVQREISELEALDGQLYLILQSLEKIQKLPITLDINVPEDFYNEDSKISGIINELKQSLDGINLEVLNNLSLMIQNLSVKDKVVTNMQKLANAILNLKSNLNNLSIGGGQFLSDLKELTAQADALKDLATIIKASKEEIKKVKEVVPEAKVNTSQDDSQYVDVLARAYADAEENLRRENEYIKERNKLIAEGKKQEEEFYKQQKNKTNINDIIGKASVNLKELESLSSNTLFAEEFKKAETALEGFNAELRNDGNVKVYNEKVKNLISNLKTMQNVVKIIEPRNIDLAEKEIEGLAKAQNAKAEFIKGSKNTKGNITSLTYAWEDENEVLHKLKYSYDEITGKIAQVGNVTDKVKTKQRNFFDFWKQGWANLARYLSTFVGFYEIWAQIKQGITVIRDLDTALTEMRKVSDESVSSLREFQKVSFDIAGTVGTTAKQIQQSAADFMRLGYELKTASSLAKDANIYANVGDMEIGEATEHMISSIKAWESEFGSATEASSAIIDRYNEIGNNFAITSADIGSAMERSAAALKAGGKVYCHNI